MKIELQKALNKFVEKVETIGGTVAYKCSIYKGNSVDGTCGYNKNAVLPSASVRKIYVLLAFLHFIEKNYVYTSVLKKIKVQLKSSEVNVVTPFSHTKKNTLFQKEIQNGLRSFSLYKLLFNMIVYSDNTATLALINYCGLDYVKNYCANTLMLANTTHRCSVPKSHPLDDEYINKVTVTTVDEVHKVLEGIIFYDCNSLDLSLEFIRVANNILSRFVPKKLTHCFKHETSSLCSGLQKGGTSQRGVTDSACIIYGDYKIIIALFTDNIQRENYNYITMLFEELSKQIYNILIIS